MAITLDKILGAYKQRISMVKTTTVATFTESYEAGTYTSEEGT